MPPVPCFGAASRSFDDNFDDGSYLVHPHLHRHPAGHSDEYLDMEDDGGRLRLASSSLSRTTSASAASLARDDEDRDSGSGRNDAWIPLNDCDDDDEDAEEEDSAAVAFDADEYAAVQGGSQRSDGREEEGSISDLNDLAGDNDEEEASSPPPRRRLPPRRRSSARPRKSRRRSSAVSLEKHDSVILSELASLMDEMDDDDLERALNESHSTGGQGSVAGGEGDAEADAAAGGGPSQTHHQRRPSHRPAVRRRSAFPLGGDGESIAGNGLVRSFRRNTISDTSSGGGIRPLSFRASLGSALLHRDHMGSNLTVQRADHHQPRRNSLEGRRSPSVLPSGI